MVRTVLRPLYAPIANWLHTQLFGARRYTYLFEAIRTTHAVRILEVGTWHGGRAVQMIKEAQKLSPSATVEYYGFDMFEKLAPESHATEISKWPPSEAAMREKLAATGATIQLFAGDTRETLPRAVATLPKMDFIFIDGGHSRETIQNDWDTCAQLMHERTIVIFDDYWPNNTEDGAKPIVDAIDRAQYDVTILPITDTFDNPTFGKLTIQFAQVTLKVKG